jgi:hypothetical protein
MRRKDLSGIGTEMKKKREKDRKSQKPQLDSNT